MLHLLLEKLNTWEGFLLKQGHEHYEEFKPILEHLHCNDMVQVGCQTTNMGLWHLTAKGKSLLEFGDDVSQPTLLLLEDRIAVPLVDRTTWEMMEQLRKNGFQFKIWEIKDRKELKKITYTPPEDPKVWHCIGNGDVRWQYLLALLLAEEHKQPVPALADTKEYNGMTGIAPKRRPRKNKPMKMLSIEDGDESEAELLAIAPPPAQRKRAGGVGGGRRGGRGLRMIKDHDGLPLPGEDEELEHLTDSSSSCSISHSPSCSLPPSRPESPQQEAVAPVSPSPPLMVHDLGQPSAPPSPALSIASVASTRRSMDVSTPFAGGRITPKRALFAVDPQSFQATCFAGHGICNKTVSVSKLGGCVDMTMRAMQYWLILGYSESTCKDHRDRFDSILQEFRAGTLSLPDDNMLRIAAAVVMVPARSEPSSGRPKPGKRPKTNESTLPENLASLPPTPPELHEELQARMASGNLPTTTAEQRRRNRPLKGVDYFTPPPLTTAFRWGYVGPCLKPPYGYHWVAASGGWMLKQHVGGCKRQKNDTDQKTLKPFCALRGF